jgi:hypothetical protein
MTPSLRLTDPNLFCQQAYIEGRGCDAGSGAGAEG